MSTRMQAAAGARIVTASFKAVAVVTTLIVVLASVVPSSGIRCYQCGQYTDGVGSITPCINYTEALHLKECPKNKNHCIKYVSEGSTVRDCEAKCTEKDAWGTKIFCCDEDGCNSSGYKSISIVTLVACLVATMRQITF